MRGYRDDRAAARAAKGGQGGHDELPGCFDIDAVDEYTQSGGKADGKETAQFESYALRITAKANYQNTII